ncbi:MAG: N-methyl-L-tryptophan oxidase [Phycisphaerales bacterium]
MHDVIVIGVGTMGAAACLELARRGVRVLGLEQFGVPHTLGSHHGHSRMFRMSYYEHPDYVPLLKRAYEGWKALERDAGVRLFHETGALYLGRADRALIRGSLESARTHGLAHEALDRAALERRFPQFRPPPGFLGVFEPRAGFVVPEASVGVIADQAMRLGAEIHGHEPVESWRVEPSGCVVRTAKDEYRADRLVFCGGAWSSRLMTDLGVPLAVTRQVQGWVQPRVPDSFTEGRFPCWALENPDGSLYYGFPMMPTSPGLKIARHARGEPFDPDSMDRRARPGDERDFLGALECLSPEAAGPVVSIGVCLYTNSPDSHFIIDRHPKHERVALACGFSGHGFKFAPVIGEVLADLACAGRTEWPIGFLGLSRLR